MDSRREPADTRLEWLQADGLGGYAMGTAGLVRTRRYHGLLQPACRPPGGRVLLVNGLEVWLESPGGERRALGAQAYAPDVVHPDGQRHVGRFGHDPWPRWDFAWSDGLGVEHELVARHGQPLVALRWRVSGAGAGWTLVVRPLLSGRDPHALHARNDAFRFETEVQGERVRWRPYEGLPSVVASANARWVQAPLWYGNFRYALEAERGFPCTEDLASPGEFRFDLARGEACLLLTAEDGGLPPHVLPAGVGAQALAAEIFEFEARRRAALGGGLQRAADAYLVRRGDGLSLIAGYPWFGDWGRDTFIALRGLCLATGRYGDAARILAEWAGAVSLGMMPNRFPDHGEEPEYNSVDASLWYVVAVHELLESGGRAVRRADREVMTGAVRAILDGYAGGTRHCIRMDGDGLLACGEPGVQLTWMDAKVGDWVVTPRIGKPVEIQALWINALAVGARLEARWREPLARARDAFGRRFWDASRSALHDVVDVNHVSGVVDSACRPNQVFAVGGLPVPLLDGERARAVVDEVEHRLWTPLGPRSLAPEDDAYTGLYRGGVRERDGAYHQGTVWPWLIGPFVEAWLRVHGDGKARKAEARRRFLAPLLAHVQEAGLGHVSEIADGDPPHAPRGCPFQAWSTGELLRLERVILR